MIISLVFGSTLYFGLSVFGRRFPPPRLQAWEETAFTTLNHREQPGVFILGALEEILMVLEDNQVTLQTMMGSRFIMGVKDEVQATEKSVLFTIENSEPTDAIANIRGARIATRGLEVHRGAAKRRATVESLLSAIST